MLKCLQLLLAIIQEVKIPHAMYDTVAARMGNGESCNATVSRKMASHY